MKVIKEGVVKEIKESEFEKLSKKGYKEFKVKSKIKEEKPAK